jgi:membrane-associated phospholipid phosphatase
MRAARRLIMAVGLALAPGGSALAQADTVGPPIPLFTYRDAVLAGSVAVGTLLARRLDDHFATRLQDSSTQANRNLQRVAAFVRTTAAPGAVAIGTTMYLTGRLANNPKLADLGLHGTEALFVGEVTAVVLKGIVGRQRPYAEPRDSRSFRLFRGFTGGNAYRSFPSGHSVAAFAAAAAVTSETSRYSPDTKWIVGPALFGGAVLAGVSRMYNNQHWASDVIAGAGIGTFAGLKVVRYHHSHPGSRIDRIFLTGSLVPNPEGGQSIRWSILPASLLGRSIR